MSWENASESKLINILNHFHSLVVRLEGKSKTEYFNWFLLCAQKDGNLIKLKNYLTVRESGKFIVVVSSLLSARLRFSFGKLQIFTPAERADDKQMAQRH